MASWIDIFSFLTTTSLFVGTILGVIYIAKRLSEAAQNTKESLENKGISISDKGVSIKTSKRLDRENYVDATQRLAPCHHAVIFVSCSCEHLDWLLCLSTVYSSLQRCRQSFGIQYPPCQRADPHKSKSSSDLLAAEGAAHSTHLFGIRRTHSGASK
ncbi:hypothetical protein BDR07DRAFT_578880 [Suillus spraguei]|nr:hypothetical protein BDR07DRAFT_578880 [Suillus spraguei]